MEETMADIFEPTREEIRHLQARLRGEEDYVSEAMDALSTRIREGEMTVTAYHVHMHNLHHGVSMLERSIVRLLTRIPPYARERDGYIEMLPRMPDHPPLNPRAPV